MGGAVGSADFIPPLAETDVSNRSEPARGTESGTFAYLAYAMLSKVLTERRDPVKLSPIQMQI